MKNILVLGAGFGGLRAAIDIDRGLKKLKNRNYKVTIIDRARYHLFTPLLYEAATVANKHLEAEAIGPLICYPVNELVCNSVDFQNSEVLGINIHERFIKTSLGALSFDYLILALGAEVTYFGIPGLKENSFKLKTLEDALAIRSKLQDLRNKPARIVIGGGGSTGIELAAEMACLIKKDKTKPELMVLEATPTLLPGFDARVIKKVENRLIALGIKIIKNDPISSASFKKIILKGGGVVEYDLFIWAGGVGANNLTSNLFEHIKRGEKNRLEIREDMQCVPQDLNRNMPGHVYAIGDIACILNPKSKIAVPLVARAAIDEGKIVAKNILENIKGGGKEKHKHQYEPKDYPYIIPAGGKFAVAKIGPIIISGFLGWVFKIAVELKYYLEIMPIFRAKMIWFRTLRVFGAND